MIGQVSILRGGGEMVKVKAPLFIWAVRVWTPSNRLCASRKTGMIKTVKRTRVKTTAANPPRPPRRVCSLLKAG